jgi:cysteine desulfurase
MKLPIYLDHHATTPCDQGVIDMMAPYFGVAQFGNANARNNHHGRVAAQAVKAAKAQIASLINGNPDHIVLTSGASEANMLAFQEISPKEGRNEILISALEHASILDQIPSLRARGFIVHIILSTKGGIITPDAVATLINNKTVMVCVMLANHEIGTIQPMRDIAQLAHQHGAQLHCDATQAVGKIPVDVLALGADSISFSAHKIYGPQGIGALYTTKPIKRGGTTPLALAVGFGAACELAKQRMAVNSSRMQELTALLLQSLPECQVNSGHLPGLLNLVLPNVNAEDLLLELSHDLSLSTGAACASGTGKPSTVLRAIGLDDISINSSIRISIGRNTTRDEIIYAADKITTAYLQMTKQHSLSKKSALS